MGKFGQFPYASIVTVVNCDKPKWLGMDLMIMSALTEWPEFGWGLLYRTDGINEQGGTIYIAHNCLKLKKYPPHLDAWCKDKVECLIADNLVIQKEIMGEHLRGEWK